MNCMNCNKETNNPKFCSRSCSATVTGSTHPKRKRKPSPICAELGCTSLVEVPRRKFCVDHARLRGKSYLSTLTLDQLQNKYNLEGKHQSWRNVGVRNHGRQVHAALLKLACAVCGYAKHVELCHIIPVSSFPLDSKLSEVNHKDNVIQLCRNCHWEFDHKLLDLHALSC